MSEPFASPEEARAVFEKIDTMLGSIGESLDRVVLIGGLDAEQNMRLLIATSTLMGLRKLFAEEAVRMGGTT